MNKINCCFISTLLLLAACHRLKIDGKMDGTNPVNPLLCDPVVGICKLPGSSEPMATGSFAARQKPVRIVCFTDPICSSCWGIEPQLRRLELEYGNLFDIEIHMGGLLPSWEDFNSGGISKPSDVAHHWDEASHFYDMPIDGDVWLEDPLPSSYPPSIAFKAAQMQDEKKATAFLRRIREMVFLEKMNICRWEHLERAALETGLNAAQLKIDFEGAAKQAFQDDLALGRTIGVRGFPSLFFTDSLQNRQVLYGFKPYEQFEECLRKLIPQIQKTVFETTPEALFDHFPTLTTKEFSVLSGKPRPEAERILTDLFARQKLSRFSSKNGDLWQGLKP